MVNGIEGDYIDLDTQIGSDVERAERGEGPETTPMQDHGERSAGAGKCEMPPSICRRYRGDATAEPAPVSPRCPCGGAGCSGPADVELHQGDDVRTEGVALPVLTIEDPNTGERISLPAGQTITLTAVHITEPGGTERGAWVPTASQAPTGLTPEQATRYLDATATTLRRLAAEAGAEMVDARLAHSVSYQTDDSGRQEQAGVALRAARGTWDLLLSWHASYVVWAMSKWNTDTLDIASDARRRMLAALGGAS